MATADLSDYRIEILCPDLSSQLRLERGTAQERLGTLFEINLALYSEDREIDMVALLGKPMAVHIKTANDERHFHGIVAHFSQVGCDERYGFYQAVLRPKLWLLGQSACCKVFRSMTVQDILKDLFQQGGVDFGGVASSPAVQFEHCVQYRETDLYFVSRLMERYGLYYFHKHQETQHVLEVASGLSGHSEVGTFQHASAGKADAENQITDWRATTTLRSSGYRVSGTKNLTWQPIEAKHKTRFSVESAGSLKIDEFEAVDEYEKPWLEELAKARMQAIDATVEEFSGQSQSPKLAVGGLFTLEGHPRADQNRQYLVVAATYQFEGHLPDGRPPAQDPYVVTFAAIDSKTPFSPPVTTRKPVVQGPHLATVTKETDEYGRVQVQFHWGNPDGDIESCPARVSQNWAGKEWGGVFLPHVDHEVIVEFLDGDPDQPIVTGRVYNQESMPPLSLPGSKSQSIIRDHGGNEILMEGAAGSQTIRIYCPNHESEIFLGKSIELRSLSDLKNFFQGNWDAEIGGNHTSMVKGNETRTIAKDVEENIIGKCSIKIGADVAEMFMGALHKTTIGLTSQFIGGVKNERIIGAEIKKIGGVKFERVNGAKITRGDAPAAEDFPDAFTKVKAVYKQKATDMVQQIKASIKTQCDMYKIGAKMYKQDVEEAVTKAAKTIKSDAKDLVLLAKVGYKMEANKAKSAVVGTAMWLAVKFAVNDGNFEVKK